MTLHLTTSVDREGDLVAVKTSVGDGATDRLEREAALLESARHPGVVDLIGFTRAGDRGELLMRHGGIHTLATVGRLPLDHVAGIVASVASTLADLHDMGIVHGRVEPHHVLLAGDGRPLLCGFAGAGPHDPAADVLGAGQLLRVLLAAETSAHEEAEPIPERRRFAPLLRRSWSGYERRALLTLADRASADDPAHRGTCRGLAEAIQEAVPHAALPAPPEPGETPLLGSPSFATLARPRPHPRPRPRPLVRAPLATDAPVETARTFGDEPYDRRAGRRRVPGALLAGGVAAVALLLAASRRDGGRAAETGAPLAVPSVSASVATTAVVTTQRPSWCAVTTGLVDVQVEVDVDGDGCPDAVAVADGVVTVGDARWAVGEPGDQLLVADWDCDGFATVAVVRAATGEVFVFDGWSDPTADLVATAIPAVTGAETGRVADPDGDGCPALVVDTPNGEVEVVP